MTYEREPSFAEWKTAMEAVLKNPSFAEDFVIVLDRTKIPGSPSNDYVSRKAYYIDEKNGRYSRVRWAVIASSPVSFGMSRMAEHLVRSDSMRTFHSLDDAMSWLDVQT